MAATHALLGSVLVAVALATVAAPSAAAEPLAPEQEWPCELYWYETAIWAPGGDEVARLPMAGLSC